MKILLRRFRTKTSYLDQQQPIFEVVNPTVFANRDRIVADDGETPRYSKCGWVAHQNGITSFYDISLNGREMEIISRFCGVNITDKSRHNMIGECPPMLKMKRKGTAKLAVLEVETGQIYK